MRDDPQPSKLEYFIAFLILCGFAALSILPILKKSEKPYEQNPYENKHENWMLYDDKITSETYSPNSNRWRLYK